MRLCLFSSASVKNFAILTLRNFALFFKFPNLPIFLLIIAMFFFFKFYFPSFPVWVPLPFQVLPLPLIRKAVDPTGGVPAEIFCRHLFSILNFQFRIIIFIIFLTFPAHFCNISKFQFVSPMWLFGTSKNRQSERGTINFSTPTSMGRRPKPKTEEFSDVPLLGTP